MPVTGKDLAKIIRENKPAPKPGNFGVPKQDQQISGMPNADKLTRSERAIYKALPGVSATLGKFSDKLDRFDKWAGGIPGKILTVLDAGAEGLERTMGLFAQMRDPNFNIRDKEDLKAAWYAGGLTADMTNLPQFVWDGPKTKDIYGKEHASVSGFKITDDLPGATAGLADARLQIKNLIAQGVDPGVALQQVRDEYYGGLGALALRAQLNDLYSHVLLDPLNLITGWTKPVEALKVRRLAALEKTVAGAADLLSESNKALKLLEGATDARQALGFAEEALQLAETAGDVGQMQKVAELLPDLAKAAGQTDITKYADEVVRIAKLSDDPEQAAQFTKFAEAALGKRQLNTGDKIAMFLTGGDPLRPSAFVKKLEKVPGLGILAKAVQLTPESKARELMTMFHDNIAMNYISRFVNEPNGAEEFVGLMHRIQKGGTGAEYGHAMLTLEGRTLQGLITKSDFELTTLFDQFQKVAKERETLSILTQALETVPSRLFNMIDENPSAVMKLLEEKALVNPLVGQMLQTGAINGDELTSLSKVLKDLPYNQEMFFGMALDKMETAMMRQAVLQFGVKEKAMITKWSEAMKSAEALAFLKLSPAYPIRNAVNNEFTMVARGLFGVIDNPKMDDFWKAMGVTPKRLLEEGLSGEAGRKLSGAEKLLQQALDGKDPNKVKEFFNNLDLGKFDATSYGQNIETAARKRATTLGTMQYLRMQKPAKLSEFVNPNVLDNIANVAPGLEKEIDNVLKSSRFMDGELTKLLNENINVNIESLLDNVTAKTGMDAREMMGDEVLEAMRTRLPQALKEGKLDALKVEMRQMLDSHVEELFQKQLKNVVDEVKAHAVAGGPNVWNHKLAEAQDLFWNAHIEQAMRMPELTRVAREASATGDFTKARALWAQEMFDSGKYYDRAFRRVDAYIQGLEEGAAELTKRGVNIPFTETRRTFKEWKNSWEGFFTRRNDAYENFFKEFEAAPKGKKPDIAEVQARITADYEKMITKEDNLMRVIDDQIAAMIKDPQIRQTFMNARDALGQLRAGDKAEVLAQYEKIQKLAPEERAGAWNEFWQKRTQRYQEMKGIEANSLAIQQGDPEALKMFQGVAEQPKEGGYNIYQLANEYGIPSATSSGVRNDKRVLATVNKYLPEGTEKFKNVADVPEDVARAAFEARAAEKGTAVPSKVNPNFIADYKKTLKTMQPLDQSIDLANYGRVMPMLDELVEAAKGAATRTPTFIKDLPKDLQDEILRATKQIREQFSSVRYKAIKFGEWRADSALLNYNRRTNFDNWLAHIAPFGFWTTGSMQKWAIESIDRPAMITNYLRTKKFMDSAGLEQDGPATRTRGKIRIPLPFAPDWMGESFIDPMRIALPFDNWIDPVDRWYKEQSSVEGRTERLLDQMLQEGKITQDQYDQATEDKAGETWDYARTLTTQNDGNDKYDAWDFATSLQAPHAPLVWAYNAAFGDKQDIGPFAPLSRITRNAATLMGVEDWNNSKWNIEAKIRKQLGLPAFDKWDQYRIKRAASNLAGTGELTSQEAIEAITIQNLIDQGKMTVEEGKNQSEAYKLSVTRSNQEFTGGVGSFALGLLGLTVTNVSTGEQNQRALQDDFNNAYQSYREANDSLEKFINSHPNMTREDAESAWEKRYPKLFKQSDALGDFFEAHPEYESRLALFDSPEEQVQKFMVDEVWRAYNELPKVNKDEVRDHLGDEFVDRFINSATRDTDNITADQMAVWLKMMHVDPLGGLTADQRLLVDLYGKVKFTDPEKAWRVETFYDTRTKQFENFYDLQSGYYELPKGSARKAYLRENPDLKEYWDWRRKFMEDNPDLVPYLTDDQKAIERAKNKARNSQAPFAVPTAQELQVQLPPALQNIIQLSGGENLPPAAERELERIAQENGMEVDALRGILGIP